MIEYLKTWIELKTDKRAVTMLEYGLVAALICAAVAAAMTIFGTDLNNLFTNIGSKVTAAGG